MVERETGAQSTIRDMAVGETGYTVPWALWSDAEDRLWIEGDYIVLGKARGTARMFVARKADGYKVDIGRGRTVDTLWRPLHFAPGTLPVVEVIS